MKSLSRVCVASLLGASAWLCLAPAEAITVVRVTRHGYILADEPDNPQYMGTLPVTNTRETVNFIQQVTQLLRDTEGFRPGQYLATMQLPVSQDPLAFYLPIRNDVRGIGQRSQADSRSETFDNNRLYGTEFPLDGFLYLNSLRYYTDPRAVNYGRYLICTQEFGHRFGANSQILPYPGPVEADAGVDASTAAPDATALDATVRDGATGPQPLARDALLGRGNRTTTGMVVNRAHWSYFFHSGALPWRATTGSSSRRGCSRPVGPRSGSRTSTCTTWA